MLSSRQRIVTPKIIQNERSAWPYWLVVIILAALVAGWFAFDYGRKQAGLDVSGYEKQFSAFENNVARLKEQVAQLRLESASHQRAAQIDKRAVEQAKNDLQQLHQEKAELKREVDLLNGLLSDKSIKSVLQLEKFSLEPVEGDRRFRIAFTLVHLTKSGGGKVKGTASLQLSGKTDGKAVQLALKDIAVDKKSADIKLGFRNFQKVDVVIALPASFEPESVIISTETTGKTPEGFSQTLPWQVDQT